MNQRNKNPKKKLEFSKLILVAVSICAATIILFSLVMIWRTQDLTPLAYLIPSIFAELGVGTAFYYHKAKAENEIKLQKLYGKQENREDSKGDI